MPDPGICVVKQGYRMLSYKVSALKGCGRGISPMTFSFRNGFQQKDLIEAPLIRLCSGKGLADDSKQTLLRNSTTLPPGPRIVKINLY